MKIPVDHCRKLLTNFLQLIEQTWTCSIKPIFLKLNSNFFIIMILYHIPFLFFDILFFYNSFLLNLFRSKILQIFTGDSLESTSGFDSGTAGVLLLVLILILIILITSGYKTVWTLRVHSLSNVYVSAIW